MKREVRRRKVYIWRRNMVVFGFGFDRTVGYFPQNGGQTKIGRDKYS